MCSSIIAQVQASEVSESTVQSLVGSMEELINDVHIQAQDAVLKCLSSEVTEEARDKVKDCFEKLENSFSLLNTETKRQRHFKKKWKIVEPVEHVLGVRSDVRKDRTSGLYSKFQSMINLCMYLFWEPLSQCLPTRNSATVSSKLSFMKMEFSKTLMMVHISEIIHHFHSKNMHFKFSDIMTISKLPIR